MTLKSTTPKSAPSKSTPPEDISTRGGALPDSLFRSEDRGKVVALLLPLARRDALLDLIFEGVKAKGSPDHPVRFVDGGLYASCLPTELRDSARLREGVSDALLFGVSKSRILIRGAEDEGWGYVPAGTPLPDSDRGWTHEAWEDLLPELTPENGTLFLFLPAEFSGARVLAKKADRQISLTGGAARRGPHGFMLVSLLLLLTLIAALAWLTGWLAPMGLPAPESIPPALQDVVQRLPRPGSGA